MIKNKNKNKNKPKWLENMSFREEGKVVKNPYTNQEYELNNVELTVYENIMHLSSLIERKGGVFNSATGTLQRKMAKQLSWFRKNNPQAYLVLLD